MIHRVTNKRLLLNAQNTGNDIQELVDGFLPEGKTQVSDLLEVGEAAGWDSMEVGEAASWDSVEVGEAASWWLGHKASNRRGSFSTETKILSGEEPPTRMAGTRSDNEQDQEQAANRQRPGRKQRRAWL